MGKALIPIVLFILVTLMATTGIYSFKRRIGSMRVLSSIFAALIIIFSAGCGAADYTEPNNPASTQENTVVELNEPLPDSDSMQVHFIDVGQADAILVRFPSGQHMLIDGGNNNDAGFIADYLDNLGARRLDHVIGTHPHEDHIGGLDVIINSFEVSKVYLPKVSHNTQTYRDLLLAVKNKGLKVIPAGADLELDVGPGAEAVMLAPVGQKYDELNNYSIVLKVCFGSTGFLFTGDAEEVSEREMLAAGSNLQAEVLKVGHHGSGSSTSPEFLKTVNPFYAVITSGVDNDYGHPHEETLDELAGAGIELFRTDIQGTIVASSDGKNVYFDQKPVSITLKPNEANKNESKQFTVEIIDIDLHQEVVTIQNNGALPTDLSGWKLESVKGNQVYMFPRGTNINTGGTLKVVSGPNTQADPEKLIWTKDYIWNNDGDPGILYSADETVVSRYPR